MLNYLGLAIFLHGPTTKTIDILLTSIDIDTEQNIYCSWIIDILANIKWKRIISVNKVYFVE